MIGINGECACPVPSCQPSGRTFIDSSGLYFTAFDYQNIFIIVTLAPDNTVGSCWFDPGTLIGRTYLCKYDGSKWVRPGTSPNTDTDIVEVSVEVLSGVGRVTELKIKTAGGATKLHAVGSGTSSLMSSVTTGSGCACILFNFEAICVLRRWDLTALPNDVRVERTGAAGTWATNCPCADQNGTENPTILSLGTARIDGWALGGGASLPLTAATACGPGQPQGRTWSVGAENWRTYAPVAGRPWITGSSGLQKGFGGSTGTWRKKSYTARDPDSPMNDELTEIVAEDGQCTQPTLRAKG